MQPRVRRVDGQRLRPFMTHHWIVSRGTKTFEYLTICNAGDFDVVQGEIGDHHLLHNIPEGNLVFPVQSLARFCRVAAKDINFARPVKGGIDLDIFAPVEACDGERERDEFFHGMRLACNIT